VVVGVPEIAPVFAKVKPGAMRSPFSGVTTHEYGDVPPVATRVAEYDDPTVALGRFSVTMERESPR
jgi:hypothetical protein